MPNATKAVLLRGRLRGNKVQIHGGKMTTTAIDQTTADAFASSWNNLPTGSVYTTDQFTDWFEPVSPEDIRGQRVLELGCGNGSLLVHVAKTNPGYLEGVDLGDSVVAARRNLDESGATVGTVIQADLVEYTSENGPFDLVYCIGVLHHLKNPEAGFRSVLRNVKSGGKFHCWVYGSEGNGAVVLLVEPLRRIASRLPWWITKYCLATPLAIPFYFYAKLIFTLPNSRFTNWLPLASYCRWIAKRDFLFFRHVAFDQLVTPQTAFLKETEVWSWLKNHKEIDQDSTYVVQRNGNSWKFGGRRKNS